MSGILLTTAIGKGLIVLRRDLVSENSKTNRIIKVALTKVLFKRQISVIFLSR